jgi:hypothetical protein
MIYIIYEYKLNKTIFTVTNNCECFQKAMTQDPRHPEGHGIRGLFEKKKAYIRFSIYCFVILVHTSLTYVDIVSHFAFLVCF